MARNFAQIVFLVYALCILFSARRHIFTFLIRKMGKKRFSLRMRQKPNRFLFLSVKDALGPLLFLPNLSLYGALFLLGTLHLLVGWFSFAATALCILDALFLVSVGIFTFFLSSLGNQMKYKAFFILYEPDNDPRTNRAFSSSVTDAVWYLAIPFAMAIGGFYL